MKKGGSTALQFFSFLLVALLGVLSFGVFSLQRIVFTSSEFGMPHPANIDRLLLTMLKPSRRKARTPMLQQKQSTIIRSERLIQPRAGPTKKRAPMQATVYAAMLEQLSGGNVTGP